MRILLFRYFSGRNLTDLKKGSSQTTKEVRSVLHGLKAITRGSNEGASTFNRGLGARPTKA
ncbi:MAG: hypothetical protein WCF07_06205 [Nitrososphaeraceae archaeon]